MNYLASSEYQSYGLEPETADSWVAAASAIVNAHCNRPTLWESQFTDRTRIIPGRNVMRLTYLPLAGSDPVVSARARYGIPRRGSDPTVWEVTLQYAMVFGLPGTWITLDPSIFDFFADTGEITWPTSPLGVFFDEMEIAYTAGFSVIPDPVKFACAQLVRNAQAMPALNVKEGTLNAMHFAYFADTLLDSTVRELLAPYVTQKVA